MGELVEVLRNAANDVMPILGAISLIVLIAVLFQLYRLIKKLPGLIDNANTTIVSVNDRVEQLQGPLDIVNNVSQTVDKVNNTALSAANGIASYAMKHSESIIDSVNSFMAKRQESKEAKNAPKDEEYEVVEKEEDFGIYE